MLGRLPVFAAGALVLVLSACGGSGSGDGDEPPRVPPPEDDDTLHLRDGGAPEGGTAGDGAVDAAAEGGVDTRELGAECDEDAECESTRCRDGVCCESECNGQCEACDVEGHIGACTQVQGAPHEGRDACGGDGPCAGLCDDERDRCTFPTVSCRPQSCADGVLTEAASCDGAGGCPAAVTRSCGGFVCSSDGGSCLTRCTDSDDCTAGHYCDGANACVPKLDDGAACSAADQCRSGHCTDGHCCDAACDGQCEACDVNGAIGTCSQVTGVPHGGRSRCAGSDACAGSCGAARDGCDYPTSACGTASCTAGVVSQALCDGAGNCGAPTATSCNGFACAADGLACRTDCTLPEHCAADHYCDGGSCLPTREVGQSCRDGGECANGMCVDGYCCDGACSGQCEACDVPTHEGQCFQVTGAPHGARSACTGSAVCQGACGSSRTACDYPTVQCRAQSCSAASLTASANCSAGSCPPPVTTSCSPYACLDATRCRSDCTDPSHCASASYYCDTATGTCQVTCFAAGTPVDTPAGLRAIETLQRGDLVYGFDVGRGERTTERVLEVERKLTAGGLVRLRLDDGSFVDATPEHPVWIEGGGFVRVAELASGDELLTREGAHAELVSLESLTSEDGWVEVWNLVVTGSHTYFVGTTPTLVHSCDRMGFSAMPESDMPQSIAP